MAIRGELQVVDVVGGQEASEGFVALQGDDEEVAEGTDGEVVAVGGETQGMQAGVLGFLPLA